MKNVPAGACHTVRNVLSRHTDNVINAEVNDFIKVLYVGLRRQIRKLL